MNPNFYGHPNQQNVNYNQMRQPRYTQPLSVEKVKKMTSGGSKQFSMQLSEDERDIAVCTHKDPTRNYEISLTENHDGSSTCWICNETFNIIDVDNREVVDMAVKNILDVLQSIKTYHLDLPEKVASDFMLIIPLIKRIPQLYDIAINTFNSHHNTNMHRYHTTSAFNTLNSIINPYAMPPGMGMAGQHPGMAPPPGYPQQTPYPPQQQWAAPSAPGMGPGYPGYPGATAINPFYTTGQYNYANPEYQQAQQPQQPQSQQSQNVSRDSNQNTSGGAQQPSSNQVNKLFGV